MRDWAVGLELPVPVTLKLSALAEIELRVKTRVRMQTEHTAVHMRETSESSVLDREAARNQSSFGK